jgi:hypothetical protein
MKRQFIISSMLALGMGIAQAQTQPMQPAPMQGGSNDPRQVQRQQDQPSAPISSGQGMGPGGVSQAAAQSFKGCLNGSAGSWTLTSDKGKSMNLSGTDNQLSPYQGQEVRIQGVQSADGPITVSSIDKVSDTCENQAASNTGPQTSSTSQNTNTQSSTSTTSQSATATTPSSSDNMSQSTQAPATSTTPDNSSAATSQNSTTTSSATTPPVSSQTPHNTVGSGQTAQSSAQSATTSTDQNAASSSNNQSTANNQSTTSSTGDQNANQGVRQYSDMDQNAGNNAGNSAGSKLPQTASPLPLLGLLGLGSLVTGVINRRKK